MIKWKYVVVDREKSRDTPGKVYADDDDSYGRRGQLFDTPEEAFDALRKDYRHTYNDTDLFEFFLKWKEVPVITENARFRLEANFTVSGWQPSIAYPNEYTEAEAKAIMNGDTSYLNYRKVLV